MADWEQLEGEANAAYAHFLAYRNLGPARTLDRAYQVWRGNEADAAPGNWRRECVTFSWVERAAAWDIHNLSTAGAGVVVRFVAALDVLGEEVIAALRAHKPKSFGEVLEALRLLGDLVPAETVEAVQRTAASGGVPAIGGQGPGITIESEPIE